MRWLISIGAVLLAGIFAGDVSSFAAPRPAGQHGARVADNPGVRELVNYLDRSSIEGIVVISQPGAAARSQPFVVASSTDASSPPSSSRARAPRSTL